MKLNLKIGEIQQIDHDASILRICPLIPFALANKINGIAISIKPTLKKFNETVSMIQERTIEIGKLSDGEPKDKANVDLKKEIDKLNKASYNIEIPIIKSSEFDGIEINGEKEVIQQSGSINKFPYRDSYFNLITNGVIE